MPPPSPEASATEASALEATATEASETVLHLLRPGTFVRLRQHPRDLPPFELIHCRGGRCWVRQQAWGPLVHWEVEHRRLRSA